MRQLNYDNIVDHLRKQSVEEIFALPTFRNCWSVWRHEIIRQLGSNYNENQILNLGDHLTNIFQQTGGKGRGQGELSAGGTAWEALVCWYINLCTVGSRVVAFRRMGLVPKAIQDGITVNYANFGCNTESDITVVIFPNNFEYNTSLTQLSIQDNYGVTIPLTLKGKINRAVVNHLTTRDFREFEIGIVQCKTNWNDNSQIPMLWDMIYSAGGFSGRNITIGRNGFNIQNVKRFSYSFVTVPTNGKVIYKPNSVTVRRVSNLSGGNYWGQPTTQGVARSLKEVFNNNFQSGARVDLRSDIRAALPHLNVNGALSFFGV